MADKFIEDYIGRGIFEGAPDTPEEVDAYLREQGYDPDSLVSRMKIRIGEALQNAKARTEREAAMKHQNKITSAKQAVVEAAQRLVNLWQAEDMLHPKYYAEQEAIVSTQLEDAVQALQLNELSEADDATH